MTSIIPMPHTQIATGATFTPTSFTLPPEDTFDDAEGRLAGLRAVDRSLPWFLGDILLQMRDRFGEQWSQAIDATDHDRDTLMDYMRICERIPAPRRRDDPLTFGHHRAVATLPEADQDRILDQAGAERWTVERIRQAVRELTADPGDDLLDDILRITLIDVDYSAIEGKRLMKERLPLAASALLYLWALPDTIPLALAWMKRLGYKYRSMAIFDYQGPLASSIEVDDHWIEPEAEFLLVGTRGEAPIPPQQHRIPAFLASRHAYNAIEEAHPEQSYLAVGYAKRLSPPDHWDVQYPLEVRK